MRLPHLGSSFLVWLPSGVPPAALPSLPCLLVAPPRRGRRPRRLLLGRVPPSAARLLLRRGGLRLGVGREGGRLRHRVGHMRVGGALRHGPVALARLPPGSDKGISDL